jgi:hypothetical protein
MIEGIWSSNNRRVTADGIFGTGLSSLILNRASATFCLLAGGRRVSWPPGRLIVDGGGGGRDRKKSTAQNGQNDFHAELGTLVVECAKDDVGLSGTALLNPGYARSMF